ncbi:MAG: hypothetical protein K6B43_08200 [Treponema sp.]|nr:hypothetical protein [Treponema sp.]
MKRLRRFLAFFAFVFVSSSALSFSEELIVYRPQNSDNINLVRCWVKIEDFDGNDVTYTAARAAYAYMDRPKELSWYQRTFYLEGGMACHLYLNTAHGEKYKISVYTPKSHVENFPIAPNLRTDWDSDVFIYDSTKIENSADKNYNPLKVIFVSPCANENWFYVPHWNIDYKAPTFLRQSDKKLTKPKREKK